ncbi:PREDICTED: non-specific lipid-transfer protein 1-like [Tarenaya hassleriana]|uniref:non-specific lipid-transfer protein 1-like n=1 Tax=Tarenaya hassleriana TaxID=28532 RepID=UPI00053C3DCE|nr:PREDICTED: non-specific lipid-transfer protein 1-like [Tarenaya hassleriana]
MKSAMLPLLTIMMLILAISERGNAITCQAVESTLMPCAGYIVKGGTPSSKCCAGLKSLKAMARKKADRQAACRCLKDVASRYPGVKDDNASRLPKKCGVDFGVPFTRKTNCNSVK